MSPFISFSCFFFLSCRFVLIKIPKTKLNASLIPMNHLALVLIELKEIMSLGIWNVRHGDCVTGLNLVNFDFFFLGLFVRFCFWFPLNIHYWSRRNANKMCSNDKWRLLHAINFEEQKINLLNKMLKCFVYLFFLLAWIRCSMRGWIKLFWLIGPDK